MVTQGSYQITIMNLAVYPDHFRGNGRFVGRETQTLLQNRDESVLFFLLCDGLNIALRQKLFNLAENCFVKWF